MAVGQKCGHNRTGARPHVNPECKFLSFKLKGLFLVTSAGELKPFFAERKAYTNMKGRGFDAAAAEHEADSFFLG